MKPAQKPKTTPRTIANCSRAMRDPRTSGGLISAIYSGESILREAHQFQVDGKVCAPTSTRPLLRRLLPAPTRDRSESEHHTEVLNRCKRSLKDMNIPSYLTLCLFDTHHKQGIWNVCGNTYRPASQLRVRRKVHRAPKLQLVTEHAYSAQL
jgi:hypothetical protein